MLENLANYGYYKELVETGYQTIYTKELNDDNIEDHFKNIINILSDGIETDYVQNMKIHVIFPDEEVNLYIVQYMYNLMFWVLIVCSKDNIIYSKHLFFERIISKNSITKYINKNFIRKNIKLMDLITLNQSIDRCIGKFRQLKNFQMYLANTVSFYDTYKFMKQFPEFNETTHLNISGVPMEDIKEFGMTAANKQVKYMTRDDLDHCLKYSFMSGEGINLKQYKEVAVNIGTKPNGLGGVFQHPISNSFINGGLESIEDVVIDSFIGRFAQILTKQNVGQSGAFARKLGLNNQDTKLHYDPEYICDSKNFQMVTIGNKDILDIYDMRYYRFEEKGMEYLLDASRDEHLIGQTLLFKSPQTCASAARGNGICYRCYGNLAYANRNINIGQIAAELLSAIYTQILLSAKHLLESAIIKLTWTAEFYQLFDVEFDQIVLKEDFDYRKYRLIINADDIVDNENDADEDIGEQVEESNYIYSFTICCPDGSNVIIRTSENDPIYITTSFAEFLESTKLDDNDNYDIPMYKLKDINLFMIDIQNDELSKVMKQVKNLIDNKQSIKVHNRNSILEAFINANLKGRIKINAVHFEVLLMNQMRDSEDILALPDWSRRNAPYQIITLEDALTNNMSISVRLQSPKLKRTLTHPSNRKLWKPSNMDLFSMVHPQDYMSSEFENNSSSEKPIKIRKPVYFINDKPDQGLKPQKES